MPNVAQDDRKYVVPVLETAMRALEEVAEAGSLGLSEVVARTGAPKATAFRVLTTLRHLGYLGRDSRRRYFATSRLASLASEDSVSAAVRQLCLPYMVRLRDEVGESVNLGRLQHELVRYVEVVPSEFALRLQETPGATVSLHATALGKAILAFSPPELTEALLRGRDLSRFTPSTVTDADGILEQLREVRRLGFARDAGESSSLAACVGAPILGRRRERRGRDERFRARISIRSLCAVKGGWGAATGNAGDLDDPDRVQQRPRHRYGFRGRSKRPLAPRPLARCRGNPP